MSLRNPRGLRRAAGTLTLLRPLAAALLIVGATCRDNPTEPVRAGQMASLEENGLTITPALDTLFPGEFVTLKATQSNGRPVSKQPTWSSSDTAIATVVATGFDTARVTGLNVGTVTIRALAHPRAGTATIVVVPVPVRSVSVAPDSASLQRGDSADYVATPKDSAGNALAGRAVSWTVADTTIATVNASGRVQARGRGTTQVLALVEGVSGSGALRVRLAQLALPAISTVDTANAADTVAIAYTVANAWDTPDADSVTLRVGIRAASGAVVAVARRSLPRIDGGAQRTDTVRLAIPPGTPAGIHAVVAYADCRDIAGVDDATRLDACMADALVAGAIPEGDEGDNSRSAALVVRGPALAASVLESADSAFTRTIASATLTVTNSGSATATAFDVVGGLVDVTTGTVVAASAVTTPVLGSREIRAVPFAVALPAGLDATHSYQLRAFADCRNSGGTAAERLAACVAAPGAAGDIAEADETDNLAQRVVVVASNVARVAIAPDSASLAALGDTVTLYGSAYDRADAPVAEVAFSWTSLDPAVATITGTTVTALANGVARIVLAAEGRVDTALVTVAQQVSRVAASPDSVTLGAIGETSQLAASVLDRNGNAIAGQELTWSSLAPAVATVNAAGVVTAAGTGSTGIVATASTGHADTTLVRVTQLPVRIAAAPDSSYLTALGDTARLTATTHDANGNAIAGASTSWTSLDAAIASVDASGAAVALSNGSARIVASNGTLADTVVVRVQQVVTSVVASPDSVIITAIGGTGSLTAATFDARGNAATAEVQWTSLDPAIASVASTGIVTAASVGRARIVALSGAGADTVLAIVSQQIATVTITPDTTALPVGGSVTFTAVARDASGNVMSAEGLAWTSLNSGVAAVTGAGTATAAAVGSTGIVATVAGHADTAVVFVNPAGYALRWTGAASSEWSDPANWYPHQIPDSTRSVYVPGGASNQPVASNWVASNSLLVGPGATLSGSVVQVYGPVDAQGQISANLTVNAATTIRGTLGPVSIAAPVTLAGRTTATEVQMIESLTLNGHTLSAASMHLTYAGRVIQTNPADSIVLAGNFLSEVATKPQMTAGVLMIGGNLLAYTRFGEQWYPDAPERDFETSGSHRIVFTGGGVHELFTMDTLDALQNVEVNGTVNFQSSGGVKGRLILAPGSRVQMANNYVLRTYSDLPEIGAGATYAVERTVVAGNATLSHSVTMPHGVFVEEGGSLALGGRTLDARTVFVGQGSLSMNTATDSLVVREHASFYGLQNLSAGTVVAHGGFTARKLEFVPGAAWNVSGSHAVVFAGTAEQYVDLDTTYALHNVVARNAAGTVFQNNVRITGRMQLLDGGRVTTNNSAILKFTNRLPEIGNGIYDINLSMIVGTIVLDQDITMPQQLFVEEGGSLRLNGHKLSTAGFGVYAGSVTMDHAADTLAATQMASFYGLANLSAGTLLVGGTMYVNPQPQAVPGAAWNVSGTHTTAFVGDQPVYLSMPDSIWAYLQNVDVRTPMGTNVGATMTVRGQMRFAAGGKLSVGQGYQLRFASQLPDIGAGVYDVQSTIVAGNVTVARNTNIPGSLFVDLGGHLHLGGRKLETDYIGVYYGGITMDAPADTLIARQYASFYGLSNFTAGRLIVLGELSVNPQPQAVPGAAWNVSGSHGTTFAGSQPQAFTFSDTTAGYLHHVHVANTAGVTLGAYSNATVTGQLSLAPGARVSASSNGMLKFTSRLPQIGQGVYDVNSTAVTGNVVATTSETFAGSVFVIGGGRLTLNGHRIDASAFSTYDGALTMDNAADTLIVRNWAQLYGAHDLSAGTFIAQGELNIQQWTGGPSYYRALAPHTTVLAGTMTQQLALPAGTGSHFGHLRIDNVQGVNLGADIEVRGQLMGTGGLLASQNFSAVNITGGLNVAALSVNGVRIDVHGGALTRFDNVTFQAAGYPTSLRIRHPGEGTFTMNNISFLQEPGADGAWIEAEDTNASTAALTLDVVSAQHATGPSYTRTLNGAVVTWRAPLLGN
jgi:hypothetical protein